MEVEVALPRWELNLLGVDPDFGNRECGDTATGAFQKGFACTRMLQIQGEKFRISSPIVGRGNRGLEATDCFYYAF